jgi:solute carrier family 45 protein 1/2/4
MWYTDFFGKVVYHGNPKGLDNSTELLNYKDGVQMGCWGLTIYCVAMVLFSVLLERFNILQRFSMRIMFSAQFMFSVVSSTVMFLYPTQTVMYIFSSCIGISYTFTATVPFVLLGRYHQDIEYHSSKRGFSKRGYGVDCAILMACEYLANLIAALISSPVINAFNSVRIILVLTAIAHSLAFLIACFCITYTMKTTSKKLSVGVGVGD